MNILDETRGSLTAIIPTVNQVVTIGNSSEPFRITEIVARGGFIGDRLVANGHYVGSKRGRVWVQLHELQAVALATEEEEE